MNGAHLRHGRIVQGGLAAGLVLPEPAGSRTTPVCAAGEEDSRFEVARFSRAATLDSIKTTIDIPADALAEAMRFTGASTKREAVLQALADFNRRKRVEALAATFGAWNIVTNDEVEAGDAEEMDQRRR